MSLALLVSTALLGTALAQGTASEAPPPTSPPVSSPRRQWDSRFYLRPRAGGAVYSSGGETHSALTLGAQAGLRYSERKAKDPHLFGHARILGDYLVGSDDVRGTEVRLGNFIGPWVGFVGAQTGPDLFWSQYRWGPVTLDPTLGLAWPVMGFVDIDVLQLFGGVEPAFYFNPDRARVDWSQVDAFGFGHEFTYMAGAALGSGGLQVSATWSYRITAFGPQQGIAIGFRLGA